MRILVVSDMHGDIKSVDRARTEIRPDLILSCGDWGDAEQISEQVLQGLLRLVPVYTTFGNHDPLEILARLKNRDESPVLIGQGLVQKFAGLRLGQKTPVDLDLVRELKRVNGHLVAAAAYPVLEDQGELLTSRIRLDS